LERENASILNASILTFAQRTIRHFEKAIRALSLTCPLYLTQNDGTLTSAAQASRLPIRTFASGPTNSMRGAAFLARVDEPKDVGTGQQGKSTIVVDIGGTTTDVGVLLPSGFPRQAAAFIEIGGVRTNFSMADVQSIGLGGGSRIKALAKDGSVVVGPDSVGHNLTRDARVFGGEVLTATDIVVAHGNVEVGDRTRVSNVSQDVICKAKDGVRKLLERIIDKYDLNFLERT
jgi:N-methylhydantoinase A/oxoprolinase/acetone carboxylase beta subunit